MKRYRKPQNTRPPSRRKLAAQLAETCHAPNSPCDSCLAGGICDGPDRTHDHHDHITDDDE